MKEEPISSDSAADPHARFHAMDSLRASAMFLGILLHVALPFMVRPPALWPFAARERYVAFDVFVFVVHAFRMPLFFIMAGFFACLLYQRRGIAGFIGHRIKRILIPFAAGLVVVHASLLPFYVGKVVRRDRSREAVVEFFTSGQVLGELMPLHLWFLYYLLFFYAAAMLLAAVTRRVRGGHAGEIIDRQYRRLVLSPWKPFILAVPTAALLFPMRNWSIDTPLGWTPEIPLLAFYSLFFGFGWVLYRHRELLAEFQRRWWQYLLSANLLVLPIAFTLGSYGPALDMPSLIRFPPAHAVWVELGARLTYSLYVWLLICGVIGGALTYATRVSPLWRYLADSAYWCYIMSLSPILYLQVIASLVAAPSVIEFAAINLIVITGLLVTYHVGVRYTIVGKFLHGRRYRVPKAALNNVGTAGEISIPSPQGVRARKG